MLINAKLIFRPLFLGLCLGFSQLAQAQFEGTREQAAKEYDLLRQSFTDGEAAFDQKDYRRAYELLRPWAEDGDAAAQNTLGYMYAKGLGVPKSNDTAWEWYLAAVTSHKKKFQYPAAVQLLQPFTQIGKLEAYFEQTSIMVMAGTPDERQQGIAFIKKYAEAGNPHAQHEMGTTIYMVGGMTPERWIEKVEWLKLSAEQGYAPGQYAYGLTFSSGAKKNRDTLLKWVKKAADQGHPEASYDIGKEFATGKTLEKSDVEAFKYFDQAAKKAILEARLEIADAYHYGRGVPKNINEAILHYRRVYAMEPFGTETYFRAKKALTKLNGL